MEGVGRGDRIGSGGKPKVGKAPGQTPELGKTELASCDLVGLERDKDQIRSRGLAAFCCWFAQFRSRYRGMGSVREAATVVPRWGLDKRKKPRKESARGP